MKKGTKHVRIGRAARSTGTHLISNSIRPNPSNSGHKKFLPPLLALLPPVKRFHLSAIASAKANPRLKINSQVVLPQQLPTLAYPCRRGIWPRLSQTLNSLPFNLRRARSCSIVGGARRLVRRSLGEVGSPRAAAFINQKKFVKIRAIRVKAFFLSVFIRVHPWLKIKKMTKRTQISPRSHPPCLCVSALIRGSLSRTPNFFMFHPCTQPRATAKLST